MVDLVALTNELLADYQAQAERLPAVTAVARNWAAGAVSLCDAQIALTQLGYDIGRGEWPCYFAGVLAVIADEFLPSLPVEQRPVELARLLDAGLLPDVAEAMRDAGTGESFAEAFEASVEEEALVNSLYESAIVAGQTE